MHRGDYDTPLCVPCSKKVVPRKKAPKSPWLWAFSKSVSWNRVLIFWTLFQENEGVCSKKIRPLKGHKKTRPAIDKAGGFAL